MVELCKYLFCVHSGREAKVGSKRQLTANTKYFTKLLRADNYKQDHAKKHLEHWSQYQAAFNGEKKKFFDNICSVKKTWYEHYNRQKVSTCFGINALLVHVIIGDMLCDTEEMEGDTHARILSSFQDPADMAEDL